MRDRLATLGWSSIETVDDDLGRSAEAGARAGFDPGAAMATSSGASRATPPSTG
jgi:hypothetical protein